MRSSTGTRLTDVGTKRARSWRSRRCPPAFAPVWALLLVLSLAVLAPTTAQASAGEVEWTGTVGSDLNLSTAAVDVGASYWWRDLIALDAALVGRLGPRMRDAGGARLGVRVALDALTFCPWLGASAGAVWQRQGFAALWRAEAGVSYRPARSWALHGRIAYEADCCGSRLLWLVGASWFGGGASDLDF